MPLTEKLAFNLVIYILLNLIYISDTLFSYFDIVQLL